MSLNYPTPVFQPAVRPGYPKSTEGSNAVTVGYVVGQDNLTGKTIASDGNGTLLKGDSNNEPRVLTQVTVNRNSSRGSRQITIQTTRQSISTTGTGGTTSGNVGKAEVDICRFPSNNTPPPPEEPDEPDPPPPPPPSDPTSPEEEDEEELEPGEGCTSESDCQWYNSNESAAVSGSGCPAGTQSRGFAQLSDGSFKVLCCGPDRPAGDGCPDDPTTYGYQCVNGRCELVPNGLYATISECEASGCDQVEEPPVAIRYNCTGTECIEAVDGQFASLEECESGCQNFNPTEAGSYQATIVIQRPSGAFSCSTNFGASQPVDGPTSSTHVVNFNLNGNQYFWYTGLMTCQWGSFTGMNCCRPRVRYRVQTIGTTPTLWTQITGPQAAFAQSSNNQCSTGACGQISFTINIVKLS